MKKDLMLKRLVENALDFLAKAKTELNEHPKYSVIHFHASIELFVKARLLAEHWTLVVAKNQEPDWSKFIAGDFKSVSLDEAANRLAKVVRSGLSKQEHSLFQEVTTHRNKMVHFFHEAHSESADNELKQNIVKQLLSAWYTLHKLITEQWRETFAPWSDNISEIDQSWRELHLFLKVVFENLRDEIKKRKQLGFLFSRCPSCGFEAVGHDSEIEIPYESECLVCKLSGRCIQIECPKCKARVFFNDELSPSCNKCRKKFKSQDLANILIDGGKAHIAAMEGDDSWNRGNCSECGEYHSVIYTKNGIYICVSCLTDFDSLQCCEWCNEPNTGDMKDSYVSGCNFCDGKMGWEMDKGD